MVVLAPATAIAAPPTTTPGQSGVQGCARYGATISGVASTPDVTPGEFGQTARGGAPIADEIAPYFGALCGTS